MPTSTYIHGSRVYVEPARQSMHRIEVARPAVELIRHGHPWVWRASVISVSDGAKTGDEVVIVDKHNEHIGRGIFDDTSPIAVRVWTQADETVSDLVPLRLRRALSLRQKFQASPDTTAYRLVNGEGDRMPGIVIDCYADVAVARLDGPAAEALFVRSIDVMWDTLYGIGLTTLVQKKRSKGKSLSTQILRGEKVELRFAAQEHGIPFIVDIARGQKTGAFLDQRENRRRVRELANQKRVLNLFSYIGGFSLFAALGGASHITSVDIARDAHETARASFRLSSLDDSKFDFVTMDAFRFLEQAKTQKTPWDLIISDPPSFAPSEKAVPKALEAYRSLHRACVDVLSPGGILCASSCSSHISASTFMKTLDDGSLKSDRFVLTGLYGLPHDHPTLASWPEGHYLKFAILSSHE